MYLHEIQAKLLAAFGVTVSVPTLRRTLKFMGCTQQVIQHIAVQRSDDLRAKFMAEVAVYDPSVLIWVDESRCDRRHSRKWAYSIRGMTPWDQRLLVRGTRYSAIPVVLLEGINDVCIIEWTVNGEKFEQFIRSCLIPILQPFNWINPHSVNQVDCCSFITHSVQFHGLIPLSCIHHITMQSSHKTQSQCRKPRSQSYWVHLSYLGYLLVLSCRSRFIMDFFSDLYSSSVRTPELSRFCSSLNCL